MKIATQQEQAIHTPTADMDVVIKENDLQLIERGFFRNKQTVALVSDRNSRQYILKTGGIDSKQLLLLETAKDMEQQLMFRVPAIIRQGKRGEWVLLEKVQGQPLDKLYLEKPEWCIETSKVIADSYQTFLSAFHEHHNLGNLLEEGQQWLFSRLAIWSKPIVDAGLIDFATIQKIKKDFELAISKKGEEFFGWTHGNIIGDHIFVTEKNLFLLDLNAVPRAGRGYHDFLRALDFMILKMANTKLLCDLIPEYLAMLPTVYDPNEVRLVFAFRNIGILGWDILHHRVEYTQGDLEEKTKLALKFIRREL